MNDIEEIPVETVGGARPPTAVGDRLMIGLAALALLGGLLIAAGNAFGGLFDDAVAAESAAARPEASAEPDATPRPTRTERPLREVTLLPGEPPEQPPFDYPPTYWVEALVELPVRATATDGGAVIDVVGEGEVVLAAPRSGDDAEWFAIQDGAEGGWIRVFGRSGEPTARVAPVAQGHFSGGVSGIAAGPSGFVAHGWGPGNASAQPTGVTLRSADGEEWAAAEPSIQSGWGAWASAWGPSGWLAAATSDNGGVATPWIWESTDGSRWTPIGQMPVSGEGFVGGLVANETGYLLALGSGGNSGVLWFSPDGITWQESRPTGLAAEQGDGFFGGFGTGLLATPHGFVAWPRTDGPYGVAEIAFSRSGRSWEVTRLSPDPIGLFEVAVVGDVVLGVGLGEDGRTRAWSGGIVGDGLALSAAPHLELAFDGAVVTRLVADVNRAYAFGYDRDGGTARAWTSAGAGWRALPVPDGGFGTTPKVAAAGPSGVVVAGARVGVLASSPVLWHLRPDETWVAERAPVLPSIQDPGLEDCPRAPATAFDFMTLEPGVAVACFGDAPMSFVAWSGACEGCWGGEPPDRPGPDWLRGAPPYLLLLPSEGSVDSGWWRQGALHPDLRWSESWSDTWLRVTGHFDDPAARHCGGGPETGSEGWWQGPEADVLYCRWAFAVTGVEVLGRDGA